MSLKAPIEGPRVVRSTRWTAEPMADTGALIAPVGGWQGRCTRKPWDHRMTAAIPHLETPETLAVCIAVLRRQTERPTIMVVDTGSSLATRAVLETMRAEDVEIHYLAAHGYCHASEPVAMALDVAQALCRTELLFHTHADCFLRRHDFLAEMAERCTAANPVVGYRMSPRTGTADWHGMVSHTATTLHLPTIARLGAVWSMQRMHSEFGVPWRIDGIPGGWPDTETGFGLILNSYGVTPDFIGDDLNGQRQVDENIDHVRSYAGSKLYEQGYHARACAWMQEAVKEAHERIAQP